MKSKCYLTILFRICTGYIWLTCCEMGVSGVCEPCWQRPGTLNVLKLWDSSMQQKTVPPKMPIAPFVKTGRLAGQEKNFSSTLFCILIGGLHIKVTKDKRLTGEKQFICMHKGTNKRSSQLIKSLKLEVYIPDSVREKERGEKTSLGRITSLFKRDKWVLGEQRRDRSL